MADLKFQNLVASGRWLNLPESTLNHPLVKGRCYYLLPRPLLNAVARIAKLQYIDRDALKFDLEVTQLLDSSPTIVGLAQGKPVNYSLLEPTGHQFEIPEYLMREWEALNPAARTGVDNAKKEVGRIKENDCAYVGWLLTNKTFRSEHSSFLHTYRSSIAEVGFPFAIHNDNPQLLLEPGDRQENLLPIHQEFFAAWKDFILRWQLTGFAGPFLPIPVSSHQHLFPYGLTINEYRTDAGQLCVPPTHPLPEAAKLRKQIEAGSTRHRGPAHLRAWYAIVENANQNKSEELVAYRRRMRFSHVWTVFHDHFQGPPKGAMQHLVGLFADFLNVSDEIIQDDRRLLRSAIAGAPEIVL